VDQRRFVFFLLIAFLILVGWELLVPKPPPRAPAGDAVPPIEQPPREVEIPPAPEATPRAAGPQTAVAAEPVSAVAESLVVIETDRARVELSNRGASLRTYRLKSYFDGEGGPLDLTRSRQGGPYPFDLVGSDLRPLELNDALFELDETTASKGTNAHEVRFRYRGPAGAASKTFRFRDDGGVELEIDVADQQGWGFVLGPGLGNPDPKSMNDRFAGRKATFRIGEELETLLAPKIDGIERLETTRLRFVGLEDTYFVTALFPQEGWREVLVQPVVMLREDEEEASVPIAWRMVPFAQEDELTGELEDAPRELRIVVQAEGGRIAAKGYFGAKEYDRLEAFERGLEGTIEWGWFGFLARPLLIGLVWIHDHVVANYGWAIVLMTIGLKLLLFPLSHKGYVSMQKMQELQPRMQAIRQKYKGKSKPKKGGIDFDAQRQMNEEMQELFKQEGASPTGGCWPMLLQIPVFFAFFKLILAAVELRQEPWILWVQDLSAPDPYFLLPIVMGATQILQQRLTPMSGDPMQRRIMQLFPWMFTIFALSFPSGLVLYWTVNNLLTIVQTTLYRKSGGDKSGAKTGDAKKTKGRKR